MSTELFRINSLFCYTRKHLKRSASLVFMLFATSMSQASEINVFFTPSTIGPGSNATLSYVITNNTGAPETDLAFTNTLPGMGGTLAIAGTPNASDGCDGVLAAPGGGGTITYTDGDIANGATCTITVDVTASTAGVHTNPAVTLTTSGAGDTSSTVDLTVNASLPGFSMAYAPSSVSLGARSTITYTMDNTVNASRVGNLDFTHTLPAGLEVASPNNASTTCNDTPSTPYTITAVPGSSSIVYNHDGNNFFPGSEALSDGAVCAVTVDVIATGVGALSSSTGDFLADFTSAGIAADTLTSTNVDIRFSKDFTDDPTAPGGTVALTYTIGNLSRFDSLTAIAFTDDFDAALSGLTFTSLDANTCGGSVVGAGGTALTFTGGSVADSAQCAITVTLTVPGAAALGDYPSVSSTISATRDGSPITAGTALESLFVSAAPVLTKEYLADPIEAGDSVVVRYSVTNSSATSAATDVAFLDEYTLSFPFPVSITLPPVPDPACGAGSTVSLVSAGTDRQALSLVDGSLAAGATCTFDVTYNTPSELSASTYTHSTGAPTATVDGTTATGLPASDGLVIVAAPSFSFSFADNAVAPGGATTADFTISLPADDASGATAMGFTLDLAPLAGMTATGLPLSNICGAGSAVTGSVGDTFITFTGGNLAAAGSCSFSVPVQTPGAAAGGTYSFTTSGLDATVGGIAVTSPTRSADLLIADIDMVWTTLQSSYLPGVNATHRVTISNNSAIDATGIFFTFNLTGMMSSHSLEAPLPTDPCGTGSSVSGTTFMIFTGGNLLAGDSCTFDLLASIPPGTASNTYNGLTSNMSATVGGAVTVPGSVVQVVVSEPATSVVSFTDDPVSPGGLVTLRYSFFNGDDVNAITDVAFTDDLTSIHPGMALGAGFSASLPLSVCGGTLSGTVGALNFAGGSVAASASCNVDVVLQVPVAAAPNTYPYAMVAADYQSLGLPFSMNSPSANLIVSTETAGEKVFSAPIVAVGDTLDVTYTLTNPSSSGPATNAAFTDDFNSLVAGMAAVGLPSANDCGAGSTTSGTGVVTLAGGTIAASSTCDFSVTLQVPAGAAAGSYTSNSSNVTSTLGGSNTSTSPMSAMFDVVNLSSTMSITPASVEPGESVVMEFMLTNESPDHSATGIQFTNDLDTLLSGLASTSGSQTVCGGGTFDGTDTLTLTGASLLPGASCTFSATLLVPLSASAGDYDSITSAIVSSFNGSPVLSFAVASGTIAVSAAPLGDAVAAPIFSLPGLLFMMFSLFAAGAWRKRSTG